MIGWGAIGPFQRLTPHRRAASAERCACVPAGSPVRRTLDSRAWDKKPGAWKLNVSTQAEWQPRSSALISASLMSFRPIPLPRSASLDPQIADEKPARVGLAREAGDDAPALAREHGKGPPLLMARPPAFVERLEPVRSVGPQRQRRWARPRCRSEVLKATPWPIPLEKSRRNRKSGTLVGRRRFTNWP